jgi:hypothetical protein
VLLRFRAWRPGAAPGGYFLTRRDNLEPGRRETLR